MEFGILYAEVEFPVTAKTQQPSLKRIDILADIMVYYVIGSDGFLMYFMVEDHRCDIFQLLKQRKSGMYPIAALEITVPRGV